MENLMKKVVITGGSGLLGRHVVEHFLEHGYDVVNADMTPDRSSKARYVKVNLQNLGECYGVLEGADAVVHLAAIPQAYTHPNEVVFQNNTVATYNILEAAAGRGIQKAVIASSESSYGLVFARHAFSPQYVPIDEQHPQLPQDCYGLSKIVNEETAAMFCRRVGMQAVSFRLGNVITPEAYANFKNFIHTPKARAVIVWSYIDARDAASACRMAIEADGLGHGVYNIAADDTSMDIKNDELMALCHPDTKDFRNAMDNFETLLSNKKAKKDFGWQPVHFWRNYVSDVFFHG